MVVASSPMVQTERRRFKRHATKNLRGTLLSKTRVDVLNISLTGLAVECPDRLDVDRRYNLKIVHDQEELGLAGRVVWCHLATTQRAERREVVPVYKAGLKFENTLSDKSKELLSFLEHNTILTLEQRIFARFKLRTKGTVDVEAHCEFVVKDLSPSGMTIVSQVAAELDAVYALELFLDDPPLSVEGRIVHVQPIPEEDAAKAQTEMGVEFVNLPSDSQRLVDDYLKTLDPS